MSKRLRVGVLTTVIVMSLAGVVALPAGAAGAWYASPTGSGTTCTQQAPCALQTAISSAVSGDDVYLLADQGDYTLGSSIVTNKSVPIHIHSLNGRARLIFSNGGFRVGAGSVDGLYVEGHSSGTDLSLGPGVVADRMFAKAAAGMANACYLEGSTLTNSICWAGPSGNLAIETDFSNTIRNVSAIGGTRAAILVFGRDCTCSENTTTLVNVIAGLAGSEVDVEANSNGTVAATVNSSFSNFATTTTTGSPSTAHINRAATDQTSPPVFIDAPAGDFHEDPSSPTIDAGTNDSGNGATDLDGNPRTINGTTDIGAYEAASSTPPPTPPDTEVTRAAINRTKHKATFTFQAIGAADGLECTLKRPKTSEPAFSACTSPKAYKRLKVGRYTFKVRAFNAAGADPTPATKGFKI